MEPTLPKRAASALSTVVGLGDLTCNQLNEMTDFVRVFRVDQQVNVITGNVIIQERYAAGAQGFSEEVQIRVAITRKLQQESSVVASVGDVTTPARKDVTVAPWQSWSCLAFE
jgi:hypothetical protein